MKYVALVSLIFFAPIFTKNLDKVEARALTAHDKKNECVLIGFGTYPFKGKTCEKAVESAIKEGYHIFDTATFYRNFDAMHNVLQRHDRRNFYIISKVWPNAHEPEALRQDLFTTLKALGTNYIDTYFLHWPNSAISIEKTLEAMQELRERGLIRHIGLSNVNVNHLKRALQLGISIEWVQVEMHPYFCDFDLLNFCQTHAIGVQAWAPLGRGRLSNDAFLSKLGKKYGKTASQIALRWIIQHDCLPLPGSKNAEHIKQNKDIFDFTLSQDDMQALDVCAKNGKRERVTMATGLGFTDEFDFSYEQCWPKKS